jgi:hypothetical protein
MSTGFETMYSSTAALVFPRVDPSDKYDPVYLNMRKVRRLPQPEGVTERPDRGKRLMMESRRHHDLALSHPDALCPEAKFTGSLRDTRFKVGFLRRHEAQIGTEGRLAETIAAEGERAAKVLDSKRRLYSERRGGDAPTSSLLPLVGPSSAASAAAGGTTTTAKAAVTTARAVAAAALGGASVHYRDAVAGARSEARQRRLAQESSNPFHPPPPPAVLRAVSEKRRERVRSEGLSSTVRENTVASTLHAYDGYAIPK